MAQGGVEVWLRFVKKSVRILGRKTWIERGRGVFEWLRCAFGGFVLRGGVARLARWEMTNDEWPNAESDAVAGRLKNVAFVA
jgi:hypothetical protein